MDDMISSKHSKDAPIGVFDSGIGGLTVVREIMRQIPNEKIVYFGDTARVPYGNKSKETVTRFSRQIVRFLQTHEVKTIVVACNTASAYALDELEKETDIPMIGVVKPGARVAAQTTRNGRIGVIATEATIGSKIYGKYIQELNPDVKIWGKACPLFVPLVEEGLLQDPVTDEIARRYLAELIDLDIDTLILGCTHYPLLTEQIRAFMGPEVALIDPGKVTAIAMKEALQALELLADPAKEQGSAEFYVSDTVEAFSASADLFLGQYAGGKVERVAIETY